MKLHMSLTRDRELLNLLISALAVSLGLLWMFVGPQITHALAPADSHYILYYFFSGIAFAITLLGLFVFVRSVLLFTEFMVNSNNLPGLMVENLLQEEYDGLFLKDRNGVYKIISPLAMHILGLHNRQVVGFSDFDLFNLRDANRQSHDDQRILQHAEIIQWETTLQTERGTQYYQCRKIPCRDHRSNIIGIIGVCRNVTALREVEQLNQQQEARYTRLFNKLPYPVLFLDYVNLMPMRFNQAMHSLLGYSQTEFSRMRLSLHLGPDYLDKFQHRLKQIIDAGGGEFETRLFNRNHEPIDVAGYAQKLNLDGRLCLHMLLYDNTETRKSTNILINSELKYRSLFEHANDAIIIVSPNTLNIIDANQNALNSLGYNREALLSMTIQDLDHAGDHSLTQTKITELEIYNHALYEHELINRNGDLLQVEINAHKLNYGHEDVYQFVLRNISARKKSEEALRRSEYRYRQMFESNMAVKLVINPDTFIIEDANPAAANFYGYSIKELQGMDLAKINILSRETLNSLIQQTREQNLGFYSCPQRLANGEIRFVEVRDGLMEIDERTLCYSIINDVTASKEAENQVLVASKMFDYATDAVMLVNNNNQVVLVNYAFSQITGFQKNEILDAAPEIILANQHQTLINQQVLDALDKDNQWKGEIWHRLKGGQSRPLNVSINRIQSDGASDAASYVVILSPKISNQLNFDNDVHYVELTHLPNRSLFVDRLSKAIDRAMRNKTHLGLILINFDNFSQINKTYGYDVGDTLLKAIAKRLQYNTRDSDTVSHFLSDDFAVLVEDLNDIQQIGIVIQKLMSTLAEDYQTAKHNIELNLSMGISIFPEDGEDVKSLLSQADAALKAAKLVPGNHFELTSDDLNKRAGLLLQAEATLHQALRLNQLELFYLPQINTDTQQLDSMEALIRWHHPQQGYILPQQFLPGSEQSGFIDAIGTYVIEQALRQCRHWLNQGLQIPCISINLYQSQLDIDLPELLVEKCQKYALDHQQVCLEFSESSFKHISQQQRDVLHQLQDLHFKLCIDDFGRSLNSLSFLVECSIQVMKIDPQLVKQALNSADAESLLKGFVSFCESQQISLVAEGVESAKDCEYLRGLHITHMQGYLFSRPLPARDVADYLKQL